MHDHHKEVHKNFIYGIILNGSFTIIELVGGIFSNSLALISDAIHDLSDTIAIGISLFANKKAQQEPTKQKTFGYKRTTILSAVINAVVLILLTFFIFYRAYLRILNPEPVEGGIIFFIALFGILFNGLIVLRMWKHKDKDINIRSIFWHISEDFLGWIGVLVAGIVIIFTDFYIIDPIISILIGLIVIHGAFGIIKEGVNVFLEGVPEGMKISEVEKEIKKIKKVKAVHDTHIWTLGSNYNALSIHVVVPNMKIDETYDILCEINKRVKEKFNIEHTTIEFECSNCDPNRVCH